jgi:streptogramin lyase
VTVVLPDGTQAILSTSFASYSEGVGPAGITIGPDGLIYMSVGGAAVFAGIEPLIGENTVFVIDPATGQPTPLIELGSNEAANNPDGTDVNPNLYGVAFGADGLLYVADAGGNTIYQVDPATGQFTLAAVVPNLTELTGEEPEEGAEARQPVPTGIVLGPDGTLLVALLSEAWPADAPSILRFEADGTFTSVAEGLAMVVSLAVGPDGAIYATQLWTGFGEQGPLPGNVVRIAEDGTAEVVVDGLFLPQGIAFDAAGNLFVATGSIFLGPDGPPGQVLRCDGVAAGTGATPVASAAGVE